MAETKKSTSKKLNQKEYEKLGKTVAAVYETGYLNTGTGYRMYFLKGVLQGFGGVIGATVCIALLLWFLSLFSEVPFLGEFIDTVHATIEAG